MGEARPADFVLSDLSLPEKVKPQPKFYETSEIKRLLAAADDPLRTILYVLVLTGVRINEALALRLEDLDFTRKLIHVRHSVYNGTLGTPKSAASVADLHMPPELEKRGFRHSSQAVTTERMTLAYSLQSSEPSVQR